MKTPWIVSARFDALFFSGSLAVPALLWLGFHAGLWTGVALYVIFQLVFNLPHHFQTWTMAVLDAQTRRAHGRRYLGAAVVTALVLGVPMLLSPAGVYPWIRDGLIYWGYFHLVRQHAGFLRLYERKVSGGGAGGGVSAVESFFSARALEAVCYLPLLLRFGHPDWMGFRVAGRTLTVWHPVLPDGLLGVIAALYAAIVTAGIVYCAVAWIRGRGQALLPRVALFGAVTLGFGVTTLAVPDFLVAVAMLTTFHNVQYFGLTGFHNANRISAGHTEGNWPLQWLQKGRVVAYVAVAAGYGVVLLAPRALWSDVRLAELPLSWAVAMHYVIDGWVWRFRDHPERGRWLKLTAPAAARPARRPLLEHLSVPLKSMTHKS